jgi:arabinogalactan oligomer/maltooligosaccharide transport system permease protein
MKSKINEIGKKDLVYKHKLRPGEVKDLWISRIIIWIFILIAVFITVVFPGSK